VRLAAALAFALAGCVSMPPSPASDLGPSLAAAETAFAAHSVREDMRAAFIAAFADDGVFVRDGWAVARTWLEPRPAPPIVLDWRPAHVEVAASGDLGLSTGPWKLASKDNPGTPPAFGQFVSIWRRERGGPWRVAVDLGIGHGTEPLLWDAPLRTTVLAGASPSETIAQAEERFARDVRSVGLRAAYAANVSQRVRFYRQGTGPAIGASLMLARDIPPDRDWSWTVERTETAASRDLGYARGSYAPAGAPAEVSGWYLRVWAAENGRWRIVLDVTNAAAKK
jgi:ketosteroid isomerase-like protein